MHFQMKFQNLSVISNNMRQEWREEKEEFYSLLERGVHRIPENDIKLILEDLHAHTDK